MNRLDTSGVGAVTVVVLGSAALLARPWLVHLPADPVWVLVALFVVLGLVGATWRLPDAAATPPGRRFVRPNRRESGEFGADHDDFGARIVSCGQIVMRSKAITTPKDRPCCSCGWCC